MSAHEMQLGLVDRIEAQLATMTNPADAAQATRDVLAFRKAAGNRLDAGRATVVYAKAARRAGELLALVPRTRGRRTDLTSSHRVTRFQEALEDCRIDHQTAHRWQDVARVDEDAFAAWCEQVQSGDVDAALGALLKLGRPAAQRTRSPIVLGDNTPTTRLLIGDVRQCLASLEPDSVQCVVTSPPYWGLRSYSTEPQVWGGDPGHAHDWTASQQPARSGGSSPKQLSNRGSWYGSTSHASCQCGAWLGELGTEPTPEFYVEHILEVMRGVRRVLRPDGVLWLNLDSSYAGGGKGPTGHNGIGDQARRQGFTGFVDRSAYKPKNIVPIPWLVAMALQAEGWYWRSAVAWCKTAPMPESMEDRPTSAWEPVMLFAKSEHYLYESDAVRNAETGANMRDFWLLGPEPVEDAHFATFPTAVPETCILAGSRPGDVVLDPFAGAGTTSLVAARLGRDSVGIELNASYARMAAERIEAEGVAVDLTNLEPNEERVS